MTTTPSEANENVIPVEKNDAILVYKENGDVKLFLPNLAEMGDETEVPEYFVLLSALAARIANDVSFQQDMLKWFDDYLNLLKNKDQIITKKEDSRFWN